jgi:hypothetical protein
MSQFEMDVDVNGNTFVIWKDGTETRYNIRAGSWGTAVLTTYNGAVPPVASDGDGNRYLFTFDSGGGYYSVNGGAPVLLTTLDAASSFTARRAPSGYVHTAFLTSPTGPSPGVAHHRLLTTGGVTSAEGVSGPSYGIALSDRVSIAVDALDQVHVTAGRYTRSTYHSTGFRDAAAAVSVVPGAAVDVTNGNLEFSLPLFATAGVGPTQACSLTHDAKDFGTGLVSRGWRLNYEAYLVDYWRTAIESRARGASTSSSTRASAISFRSEVRASWPASTARAATPPARSTC